MQEDKYLGPGHTDVTVKDISDVLRECRSVAPILSQVGDKWTVLIIVTLKHGPRRFNEIKRSVTGISQQMLTRTLKALERDGMVIRTTFSTNPPQVQYELSDLGRSLSTPVLALGTWVRDNILEIEAARLRYEKRNGG
jgi:DNA-binding HxlR family transcriptional regulator